MKFLIVDDDAVARSLTIEALGGQFADVEMIEIGSPGIFSNIMDQGDFDLVITEFKLALLDGLIVFREIHKRNACIPVIMLTDSGNETLAVTAIKSGIADYIVKSNRSLLADAVAQSLHESGKKTCSQDGRDNDNMLCPQKYGMACVEKVKFRAVFDNVSDGIIISDEYGVIEDINPSAENMFGYQAKELIGRSINILMTEPYRTLFSARLSHYAPSAKAKVISTGRELCGLRKDGSIFSVELGISVINPDGRHRFIGAVHDVSKYKQAEDSLRKLARHLELAREDERAIIAREIHDEMGSVLTVIKMDINWLCKQLPENLPKCREKTEVMSKYIDNTIQIVRKVMNDLRPDVLDHFGLFAAIESYVDKFREQTDTECILNLPQNEIAIDQKRSTVIFRIVQEALHNIVLHAMATQITIDIKAADGILFMRIMDNGCGMTPAQMSKTGKFGIKSMCERARYFDGEIIIDGRPGQGVLINLRMPLQSNQNGGHHD